MDHHGRRFGGSPVKRMSADEVTRRMKAIPEEVKKAVFEQQRANAQEIASTMRRFASASRLSGALTSSIRVEVEKRNGGEAVFVRAGGRATLRNRPGKGLRRVFSAFGFGKKFDYARAVEFGTKHTQAQPFFWPVVRLLRKSLRRKLNKVMRVASEKEFAG